MAWLNPSLKTLKRVYVNVNLKPDAATVIRILPIWFADYNAVRPHAALYRSPNEFRNDNLSPTICAGS